MTESEEDQRNRGYHSIPNRKARESMSEDQLAVEMLRFKERSPAYILLEHELNLRLAKIQAKATLSSGWVAAAASAVSTLIGVIIGYYLR